MTVTTEPRFYDADILAGGLATLPLAESPWRPLYQEAASWIAPNVPVVDLGCGSGRFCDELHQGGLRDAGYLGVDFSPAAIEEASRYNAGFVNAAFRVADLRDFNPGPVAGNTVFVCLETLEHLDDDRELVKRIPPGARAIVSVPNFPSEAHLRTFPEPASVWRRYDYLLEFRRWSLISFGHGKAAHLVDARRRVESWS
jgi:2-polyprenyl-3-methyl-5-hydroxy-6-metoxy-1,4-benzoquinol methylase